MISEIIDESANSLGPALLTSEQVQDYLQVTQKTLYRMIRRGVLPAVRIGRQWRFRPPDIDRYVKRQSRN